MAPDPTNARSTWQDIPRRSFVLFLAAVFCTFAILGFVGDISDMGRQSPIRLATSVMLSGSFAVVYAYSGIRLRNRFWKVFFPLLLLQILVASLLANLFPDAPHAAQLGAAEVERLQSRLNFDGIATTIAVSISYA